jgi:hypothetical protein
MKKYLALASSVLISVVFVGPAIALDTTGLLEQCTKGSETMDKETQTFFLTYCTCLVDKAAASELKTSDEWGISDEGIAAASACAELAAKK